MAILWKNKSLHLTEEHRFNVEGGYVEDGLLVSGPGSDTQFGGLYYVKKSGWMGGAEVWCIDRLSSRGVDSTDEMVVRSIQADGHMIVTIYGDTTAKLVVSDKASNVHDVRILDGKIYAVSTGTNEVLQLNKDGSIAKTWSFGSGKDSWHINGVDMWDGKLVASAFGKFEGDGAYEGKTRGAGMVFEVESQKDVWTGLSGPHTPRSDADGRKYICDSGSNRLMIKQGAGDKVVEFPGAFPRGLAFGRSSVYVGLNFLSGQSGSSKIAVLDKQTFEKTAEIQLEIPEIYDIVATRD
jgi:hypothetical protein